MLRMTQSCPSLNAGTLPSEYVSAVPSPHSFTQKCDLSKPLVFSINVNHATHM